MAMRLDPAGHDEPAPRVDLARAAQAFADGGDAPVLDADIGEEAGLGGGDLAAADDEIVGHPAVPSG